jgi:hypothetical protein
VPLVPDILPQLNVSPSHWCTFFPSANLVINVATMWPWVRVTISCALLRW